MVKPAFIQTVPSNSSKSVLDLLDELCLNQNFLVNVVLKFDPNLLNQLRFSDSIQYPLCWLKGTEIEVPSDSFIMYISFCS